MLMMAAFRRGIDGHLARKVTHPTQVDHHDVGERS
jgi:hypothetical protein